MLNKITSSTKYKILYRSIIKFINANFINNAQFLPHGTDRVYHIHVRKSGGSSVNEAFWKLANYNLNKAKREPLLIGNNRSIVRYSDKLINEGNFFYASSHFPIWELDLLPNTFTFTILREPYERLVSLYRYYKWVEQTDEVDGFKIDPSFPVLKSQTHLLNKNFSEFIDNLSQKYLYGNLYMFDKDLNVDSAILELEKVDCVLFQDNLSSGIQILQSKLNLESLCLPEKPSRRFDHVYFTITKEEEEKAKSLLAVEFDFFVKAKSLF